MARSGAAEERGTERVLDLSDQPVPVQLRDGDEGAQGLGREELWHVHGRCWGCCRTRLPRKIGGNGGGGCDTSCPGSGRRPVTLMFSSASAVNSDAEGTAEPSGACSAGPACGQRGTQAQTAVSPQRCCSRRCPPPQGPEARTDCTVSGLPHRKRAPIRKSQIGRSSPVVFSNSAKLDCGHSLVHGSFSVEVHGAHGYFL